MASLLPEDQLTRAAEQRTDILTRNRKVFTAFRRELRKAGLSPQTVEAHVATIADFASTILLASDPPRGVLDLTVADIQSYLSGKSDKPPLTSFKRFVRFLIGTGRISYEMGRERLRSPQTGKQRKMNFSNGGRQTSQSPGNLPLLIEDFFNKL